MAKQHITYEETYTFPVPSVDRQVASHLLRDGYLRKAVGVDGRKMGGLALFPGFRRLRRVMVDSVEFSSVEWMQYFELEKIVDDGTEESPDPTPYLVRGFFIRGTLVGGTEAAILEFYDGKDEAWDQVTLATGSGVATARSQVTTNGRYLYYAREQVAPRVVYWDDTEDDWQNKEMGPGTPIPRETPVVLEVLEEGGVLEPGTIQVAYRFANKDRKQYSALSELKEVQIPAVGYLLDGPQGGEIEIPIEWTTGSMVWGSGSVSSLGVSGPTVEGSAFPSGGHFPVQTTGAKATVEGVAVQLDHSQLLDPDERASGWRVRVAGPIDSEFETIQVYRSLGVEAAGGTYAGGYVYLEAEYDMPKSDSWDRTTSRPLPDEFVDRGDGAWEVWVGSDGKDPGSVEAPIDEVLVSVPDAMYDPLRDAVGAPPQGGVISFFEGVTFMMEYGEGTGDSISDIRWSNIRSREPENFPDTDDNRYTPSRPSQMVMRFEEAGNVLLGMSEQGIFRITRYEDGVMVIPQLQGYGITDAGAVASAGSTSLYMTSMGPGVVDAKTMVFQFMSAVDEMMYESWGGDLDDVRICKDQTLGVIFVLNTADGTAFLVWQAKSTITELEGLPFVACCSGPEVTAGSKREVGYFMTDGGLIVYPDSYGENTVKTLLGVTGTVTGTVTAGTTGGFTDTGASFAADLQDCRVYFFDSEGTQQASALIASNTETTVTFSAVLGSAITVGWRYEISPIVFDAIGHPFGREVDPAGAYNRQVTQLQVRADSTSGSPKALVGVTFGDGSTWASSVTEITMDDDAFEDAQVGLFETYPRIYPRVRVVDSDVDFRLSMVHVIGHVTGERVREIN